METDNGRRGLCVCVCLCVLMETACQISTSDSIPPHLAVAPPARRVIFFYNAQCRVQAESDPWRDRCPGLIMNQSVGHVSCPETRECR